MTDSGSKNLPNYEAKIDEDVIDAALKQGNDAPVVNIKCRSSFREDSRHGACKSSTVYDLTKIIPHLPPGVHLYKCTECGYQWSVAVGGSFNF